MLFKMYVNGLYWCDYEVKDEIVTERGYIDLMAHENMSVRVREPLTSYGLINSKRIRFDFDRLYTHKLGPIGFIACCNDPDVYVDMKNNKLRIRGSNGKRERD